MVVTALVAAVCVTLGAAQALASRLHDGGHAPQFKYADLDAATYQVHSDGWEDYGDYAHRLSRSELASLRQRLAAWHIEPQALSAKNRAYVELLDGSTESIVLDFHGRAHTYSLWHDMPRYSELRGDVDHLDAYLDDTLESKLQRVDLNSGSSRAR